MIHIIEPQRTVEVAAAQIAKTIRRKAHNGHYRNRLHYVAKNQDGSFAVALEGTSGADFLMRNMGLIIGSYLTTRDEAGLAQRIAEDAAA